MHLSKISALIGTLLCLAAVQVHAMTCEECKELESNIAATDQDIKNQDAEIERAFQKKDFAKVTQTQKRLAELSKKLVELKTQSLRCKDACRPDVVKRVECGKLLTEIAVMEADSGSAETDTERIDAKYKALLQCHQELQQILKEKH